MSFNGTVAGDLGEGGQVASVWAQLCDALAELARDMEARMSGRCPYRAANDACTFVGPCENQVTSSGDAGRRRMCGGDGDLEWADESTGGQPAAGTDGGVGDAAVVGATALRPEPFEPVEPCEH